MTTRTRPGPAPWPGTDDPGRLPAGLPVAVDGPAHVVTQVATFVEATLGWQVTDGGDLPPRVRLVGVGATDAVASRTASGWPSDDPAGSSDRRSRPLPTVLLVGPDDAPMAVAQGAAAVDAVVAWPDDHARLARVVADLLAPSGSGPGDVGNPPLRVAGAAGGVGTTTVALAIGGWLAWAGGRGLVVVSGDVPVPGTELVSAAVVAGHRSWAAAVPVPDVARLRVVATTDVVGRVEAPEDVGVVVDDGVLRRRDVPIHGGVAAADPDVLVVRRDRVGCDAVASSSSSVVVVVDVGPRRRRDVAVAAAGRPMLVLPWSTRVIRAHDHRAVPGSLPRAVLDPLRGLQDLVRG